MESGGGVPGRVWGVCGAGVACGGGAGDGSGGGGRKGGKEVGGFEVAWVLEVVGDVEGEDCVGVEGVGV